MKTPKLLILVFLTIALLIPVQLAYGWVSQSPLMDNHSSEYLSAAHLSSPFELRRNQAALIGSEQIVIRFLRVIEDSRCPYDSFCKWEGQVTIELEILWKNQLLDYFNLTLRKDYKELALRELNGYSVELQKVEPYPNLNQEVVKLDYVITLVIRQLGV